MLPLASFFPLNYFGTDNAGRFYWWPRLPKRSSIRGFLGYVHGPNLGAYWHSHSHDVAARRSQLRIVQVREVTVLGLRSPSSVRVSAGDERRVWDSNPR